MKYLLVVGTRTFENYSMMQNKLKEEIGEEKAITIVSGGAKGADRLAKEFARRNNYTYIEFPAKWNLYGKKAGYIRNEEMHKFIADKKNKKVIAFWNGKSKGTKHNFELAKKYNNKIEIIITDC